ncbi:MAG: branched-chain amino acid ABC transporter permease [Betaproteobacteria bacterium]|nr:MAG: branched-chain amino acid ABC transporter permease [Betaproteobacteria bacterium]
MESRKKKSGLQRPLIGAILFALAVLPVVYPHPFAITLLVFIGIYIIVCTGLSLIFGYAGQLSLTQAAFYGIGAYTSAILTTRYGVSFWLALAAASALPGLIAWALGAPILRLRHFYLAMATLAFSEIVLVFFIQEVDITGGPTGITHVPAPEVFGYKLDTTTKYYYLVWLLAVAVVGFSYNLIRSKYGRALRAIAENEVAASAMGVNVPAMMSIMFVLSAVFAGLGGSLYAHYVSFVSPDTFSVSLSIMLVIMVAIGGVNSLWGAVFGAVFVTVLPSMLGAYRQYAMLVYGVVLVLALMFMPNGITGLFQDAAHWIGRRRAASKDEVKEPAG